MIRIATSLALPLLVACACGLVTCASPSPAVRTSAPPPAVAREQSALHLPPPPLEAPSSRGVGLSLPPAVDVRLAPEATQGALGAWLVAGPFKASRQALDAPPLGLPNDTSLRAVLGAELGAMRDLGPGKSRAPARWALVSTGGSAVGAQDPGTDGARTLDLKAALEDCTGTNLVAYASGRLHVERAGHYFLSLGVDDGVRVSVDGAVVHVRDDARPVREDDDIVALDLSAGDHEIVLKLHQRDGAWGFRAKILDHAFAPPPGAYLALPGTTAEDAQRLAAKMSWLVVDRAFAAHAEPPRYEPRLVVRYPEGAPRGVPLPVTAKLGGLAGGPTFELGLGHVAITERGVEDLVVPLPPQKPWLGGATLETTIAGRVVLSALVGRPQAEHALARIDRVLAKTAGDEPWLKSGSIDSVRHLASRLARFVARGDGDVEAQATEADELERFAENIEQARDPYDGRTGAMRRALATPFDDALSELGLYVPPSFVPGDGKKYPLVVGLHGMNSYPMSMMRAVFGLDDEKKEPAWKDRHPAPLPPVEAFVVTPHARGNSMYREIGEDDVLFAIDWATRSLPIDQERVTITGPSMGGIGSAAIPLHFPHVFAAAAPLCGYHSYLIRADIAARPKRPWERLLLEERSNASWAENGEHLPLWIVHGTRDLPEANSGVLIERYEKLGYSVKHDHPDAGHNVWGPTYAELRGLRWLLAAPKLDAHPSRVRFRTIRSRYAKSAWVTVDALEDAASWADVDARVRHRTSIVLTTSGVAALSLRRDEKLVDQRLPITVVVDGVSLAFDEDEPLSLHRPRGGAWTTGKPALDGKRKGGRVSGPIRDVFHEPLLFVYAAGEDARANERVARGFASRPGVITAYPVMTDIEFLARKEPLANERALFLVGRENRVLAALASAATNLGAPLPLQVDAQGVTLGRERFSGREVGGAFVHPNPLRPDRYLVVVAGADGAGTLRALSLPDLLPDFVVWDEAVAPARGQVILGAASLRAGGFFSNDWALPPGTSDPLAKSVRPIPTSEREATPYLP